MGLQKHSKVLNDTVEMLSDEGSYHQLFHAYRDEEALPSGEVLKEIIDLCRAILFPGYYGNARISKQTIRFHTGVNVGTLHTLLSKQIYAGLCFADTACVSCPEEKILTEAEKLSEAFIRTLPEMRALLATDAEAAFNGDPAAQNINEVIFCYPGFRAVCNYRIAHQLYRLGVPFIPRMITEMAHSETGIDIHPGAEIGHYFSIDHGTGTVIGETSVIGNHVRIFQGVSLAGEKLPPDENGNIAQKTEDNIGPYELHDFFLYNFVRFGFEKNKLKRLALKAFDGKYDERTISKWLAVFTKRFFISQFKRSCIPDSPKVGSVSLSPRGDWRMPSDASFNAFI